MGSGGVPSRDGKPAIFLYSCFYCRLTGTSRERILPVGTFPPGIPGFPSASGNHVIGARENEENKVSFYSGYEGKSGGIWLQPRMQTPLHNPVYQWPGSHSAMH